MLLNRKPGRERKCKLNQNFENIAGMSPQQQSKADHIPDIVQLNRINIDGMDDMGADR